MTTEVIVKYFVCSSTEVTALGELCSFIKMTKNDAVKQAEAKDCLVAVQGDSLLMDQTTGRIVWIYQYALARPPSASRIGNI